MSAFETAGVLIFLAFLMVLKVPAECNSNHRTFGYLTAKIEMKIWQGTWNGGSRGGPGGPGPSLTLGFEAPKLSIFGPYLIFP